MRNSAFSLQALSPKFGLKRLGAALPTSLWRSFCSSKSDSVLIEKHKAGEKENLLVTLNRPKALNALNISMIRTIYPVYKELTEEAHGVVVIKGDSKAFCAGGDIRAIYDAGEAGKPDPTFFFEEYQLNHLIGTLPNPHVALIDGITMGGGVGLSVHGEFRVATENTTFAMPETGIGFFCDVGGTWFLPRLSGGRALGTYLALTGHRLKGVDIVAAGIATHFVKSEKLADLEKALISLENATNEDVCNVLDQFEEPVSSSSVTELREKVEKIFNKKSIEKIFAKLDSSKDPEWAEKTKKTMRKMSPTSLKVVLESLLKGHAKNSLKECLEMEYGMAQTFLHGKDFYAGVRSVLVTKDRNPTWTPATVEEVTREQVDAHFEEKEEKLSF